MGGGTFGGRRRGAFLLQQVGARDVNLSEGRDARRPVQGRPTKYAPHINLPRPRRGPPGATRCWTIWSTPVS